MNKLAWLLASLALAAAPHLERLPLWVGPLCLALGLWRLAITRRNRELPKKWLLFLLAGAATAGVVSHYHTLFGRDAGVALLVAMIALKLMEMRTLRDTMVVIFLGYFLVITNFLYSQSIPTALYLLLVVLITTATMIAYSDLNNGLATRPRLRLAGVLLLQAIPLMLVLFVFFPRIAPLWGLPRDSHAGMTGLSDNMSPGAISQLIGSDAIAFRVKFEGPPPDKHLRYWRGPVLWDYDSRTWSTHPALPISNVKVTRFSPVLNYTITLEPHNQKWLFALDIPAIKPPGVSVTSDLQLLSPVPVRQRVRYDLSSYVQYRFGHDLDDAQWERALALPEGSNPRAVQLGQRWRATLKDSRAIVDQALGMFREEPFVYTLQPPLLGQEAMDEFLFGTRRGFCEHYASAFVLLMRAAGVPARVVTGYQGGELNPLGDYLIVRQSDAHAWAEVWLEQQGWVRIDPTAAVSPSRIESGIATALPGAELPPALVQIDLDWLRRARLSWDLINNNWNQWVLGYGEERQSRFLSRFHAGLASWQGMALTMIAGLTLLLLGIAAWMLWRAPRRKLDPVQAAYERFCARLARRGLVRLSHEGPVDFALRVKRERPDLTHQVDIVTRLYLQLRYGRHHRAWLPQLRRAVRRFTP